jgi:chemotaxis protein CheY-P-specific phosphatase CheC
MDREALKEAMKTSISEVLETMFFLPLEMAETRTEDPWSHIPREKLNYTRLKFQGPFSGEAFFLIPFSLGTSLTGDFLGQEANDIGTNEVEETTRELLNMICGKALSLLDPKAVFKLGIPETIRHEELINSIFSDNERDITLLCSTSHDQLAVKIAIHS